jgi:hypothetical protein
MIPFVDVWNDGEVEDLWFKDLVPEVSIPHELACINLCLASNLVS